MAPTANIRLTSSAALDEEVPEAAPAPATADGTGVSACGATSGPPSAQAVTVTAEGVGSASPVRAFSGRRIR